MLAGKHAECVALRNTPHGSVGMVQARPTRRRRSSLPKSHPRQWVDGSSSTYKERAGAASPKSHPRQRVDGSSSTYKERAGAASPESHPRQRLCENSENPTNAVGGWFKLNLHNGGVSSFPNPTHGSGWMVQAQPTQRGRSSLPKSHPRQWVDGSSSTYTTAAFRPSQIPPTVPALLTPAN